MAHELFINVRGKASMAYVNDTPWHGLGNRLTVGAPLEVWAKESGMDFTVESSPLTFQHGLFPKRTALFRSDTQAPLSIVGDRYKVVQPAEVLEFFRDLTNAGGFELETAGVLCGGSKYWALARTGQSTKVGGAKSKDIVDGYLLLATACDGSLRTTAQFTSVRVVCNNTLTAAVGGAKGAIKVSHATLWDTAKADEVKAELGLDTAWLAFRENIERLAQTPVSDAQAIEFVTDLVGKADGIAGETILQLFAGKGRGAELKSAKGTAWGLLNACTEYSDHLLGNDQSNRLERSWFSINGNIKDVAYAKAMELVAA